MELGGGYVSYAPDLRGCVSDGETPDEALRNIYDAIAAWLDCEMHASETDDERQAEISVARLK